MISSPRDGFAGLCAGNVPPIADGINTLDVSFQQLVAIFHIIPTWHQLGGHAHRTDGPN